MDMIITSPYFLAVLFFIVAITYSSVGLGGGSSYTALMAIFGFTTLAIPMISLSLNLLVTSVGSFNFIRNKHAKIKLVLPFLIAGSVLGLVAGIVGIGGGIYLVPLIIILGLGTEKEAAACGAIFIWFNSCSGLLSRFQHNSIDLTNYIPLIITVLAGGTLGSFMGSFKFSPKVMEKILGAVIIVAIFFLTKKVVSL
jgi:uncharacterized membrane protein YfcA